MMTIGKLSNSGSLLGVLLLFLSSTAYASNCSMLSYSIDEARSKLQRTADETDFETAKGYARQAKSALEDAAMAAMDCKCITAYSEFDTASSRARRARDADSINEFVDALNRSIDAYNEALGALRVCFNTR